MASPFPSIVSAVKTVLDGISGMPTTVVRKADVVLARDTFPLCVVSYAGEGAEDWAVTGAGGADQGDIGKVYSVRIALYRVNQADVAGSATNPDLVDAVKEALNRGSLAGVAAVWDTELEAHEEWEPADFARGGEVTRFRLYFRTGEARNG